MDNHPFRAFLRSTREPERSDTTTSAALSVASMSDHRIPAGVGRANMRARVR